ncbi:MAG: double-strand break repair helicase AddA, partial [Alphaproteobacteria bacterium]|nr:double-strand break repair helicase AddA [Alphaproteobacteria bacterium]
AAKRYSARLDYDDLILKARALLLEAGAAAWVLYKLDGGIDHILIDEAQDTSREQWDVVAALAEEFFVGQGACQAGRTIFAVGDPKQSIFSFQRADPAAFARFGAHFGARAAPGAWRRVALTTSFRSVPAVLRVVDRVFANPAAREGLLQGDDPIGHRSHRRGQAGLVELWAPEAAAEVPQPGEWRLPLEREEQESAAVRLARRIARTIRGWLDGKEILDSRARPIQHGDIMILVQRRTTTFFEEMVRALKQADISVAGVDRMVLTDHLAVMDLIALGHFLLLPDDDLTLATLLRSPLVGFSEELLAELALGRTASLWRTLQRRAAEHPDFAAAGAALGGLLAGTDYHPPFELFAQVLSAGGGRERLLGRIGAEAAEPVEEFLARALEYEREHAPSLQGFLHWLETGRAEVRRDLEHGRDEVRLLTVHGAKGLEAPIVFLPDTCRVPRLEDKLLWPEGTDLVLWPPRKDACDGQSLLVRETAEQRLRSEYRRLLYVALTRAEERLYVCGWNTLQARAPGCWYDLIAPAVRELGSEVAGADGAPFWRVAEPRRSAPDHPSGPARETPETRPPAWLGATAPVTPADARLTPSRPAGVEPVVRSPLGRAAPAWRRGVLIHRLLQTLPAMAAGQREAAAAAYLAQPGHGLRPAEQDEIRRVTLGVLATPDFAPLFGPGSRAEVPLAGRVAGRVIVGQVDRLAVSGEEVLVIDYKTHRPPPRSVDEVPTIYLQQMAAYQALLGAIHAGRTVRCALLWTEGPLLMPLSADALAPHQP